MTAALALSLALLLPAADKEAPEVTLQAADYDQVLAVIAGHEGKVIVMDAWSSWCEPCVKEFPNLVKLHHNIDADRVACISLSFDYDGLGDIAEQMAGPLDFLQEQGAVFDNLLAADPDDMYAKFKFPSVPAVLVFDQTGKMVKRFDHSEQKGKKPFSYDDVAAYVDELLAAGE